MSKTYKPSDLKKLGDFLKHADEIWPHNNAKLNDNPASIFRIGLNNLGNICYKSLNFNKFIPLDLCIQDLKTRKGI